MLTTLAFPFFLGGGFFWSVQMKPLPSRVSLDYDCQRDEVVATYDRIELIVDTNQVLTRIKWLDATKDPKPV